MFCADSSAGHPLDPLSAGEIATAVAALEHAGDTDSNTRFALIDLDEPEKPAVLSWRAGQSTTVRRAFIVARQRRTVYEGVVNVTDGTVEHWRAVPNVQSALLPEEWKRARQTLAADPRWRAALRRRGYDPVTAELICAPLAVGNSADRTHQSRRLLRFVCYDTARTTNVWGRPLEGLSALVDLDENRVIGIIDTGPVAVSPDLGRFDTSSEIAAAAPGEAATPTIAVDHNAVRWRNWSFRYRLDPRTGLILSLVRLEDGGRERMVLYRGSLSEMFVPYMDPDPNWTTRNFMDVGEYGLGPLSLPLMRGIDCPASAVFLDAVLADGRGVPHARNSVICFFERDSDAPLWRHAETANNTYAGRPATALVARTIASVGNYDYVIDWVLTPTGVIRIDVGATGIDQVKGVRTRSTAEPSAPADTAHGTLVAPNLVAVNHDHFLSFRLDLDIDGVANRLVRQRLVREVPAKDGRRVMWRVVDEPVAADGRFGGDGHGDADLWRIENPNLTNGLGQHPAYEVRLGHTAASLLGGADPVERRAGFAAAPLWVTAYDRNELYAAGPYPNQSRGGDGLPLYASRRRPVANADIVLWCTLGFRHVPRPEDWPVLPTMWHSLSLVPYGFFDRNPTVAPP